MASLRAFLCGIIGMDPFQGSIGAEVFLTKNRLSSHSGKSHVSILGKSGHQFSVSFVVGMSIL